MSFVEKAQKIIVHDRFAFTSGVELADAAQDYAVCTLRVAENHFNAAGLVQGGAIFTLADTAFAIACNSRENLTVAINNNISFLKSARGGVLTATARLVSASKKVCTYEVEVTDDAGGRIARMTGTGFVTDRKLSD
jgi:acyl-CoA thioesterase